MGGVQFNMLPGEWACEIVLWAASVTNTGYFLASMSSEIITLLPDKFRKIAQKYPETRDSMRRYAELFIAQFNAAGEDSRYTNLLFNDIEIVDELVCEATEAFV